MGLQTPDLLSGADDPPDLLPRGVHRDRVLRRTLAAQPMRCIGSRPIFHVRSVSSVLGTIPAVTLRRPAHRLECVKLVFALKIVFRLRSILKSVTSIATALVGESHHCRG